MQNKFNDPTSQRPDGQRPIDAPLVKFNLELSLTQIRNEQAYKDRDRNAITLFKSANLRHVLISLHAGAEMKTHQTEGMTSLQVLDGDINFTLGELSLNMLSGEVIVIHEEVPHGLIANKETAILLTMTSGESQARNKPNF